MLALHARMRPKAGPAGDALLVLGVGSAGAISVLQLLLVTGRVTFEEQIGPVSVAFLLLAVWFVRERPDGIARPGSSRAARGSGILAATYAGYPVWAFRLARALEAPDPGDEA